MKSTARNMSTLQIVETPSSVPDDELMLGQLVHVDEDGCPFIALRGAPAGHSESAHTTVDVAGKDVGRWVVVKFLRKPQNQPVILGFLRMEDETPLKRPHTVRIEGQRVIIAAEQEVQLKCARAKVGLDRGGRVDIRGENVTSRAAHNNKIKGRDIRLN